MIDNLPTIRVMIADDHKMVRRGLTAMINGVDGLELAGEAVNGMEAVRLCSELHPDVVLMDLIMPEMDGITATRVIRSNQPDVQVIALTSLGDSPLLEAVLQAGAAGYLPKNTSVNELIQAIWATGEN